MLYIRSIPHPHEPREAPQPQRGLGRAVVHAGALPRLVLAARGPNTLPSEDALAELCKASADRLRLRVLRLLSKDAMDVSELCEVLGVRQPALSHHLKLMSAAGLLSSQRDGNHIFYRRNDADDDSALAALRRALFVAADALVLDAAKTERESAAPRLRFPLR